MNSVRNLEKYAEETGGIFSFDDLEAIPYNHWKKDCEWLVLIIDVSELGAFVPVTALTAREACIIAISHYTYMKELYD